MERFTDRSRKVMALANQEAQRYKHYRIGPEHILLGLIKEGTGVAINVIKNLDVDPRDVQRAVDARIKPGTDFVKAMLLQTDETKRVIEIATAEARAMENFHGDALWVGTEHLLLALLRLQGGIAAEALAQSKLAYQVVRDETVRFLKPTNA